jgi:hypothetical protein
MGAAGIKFGSSIWASSSMKAEANLQAAVVQRSYLAGQGGNVVRLLGSRAAAALNMLANTTNWKQTSLDTLCFINDLTKGMIEWWVLYCDGE